MNWVTNLNKALKGTYEVVMLPTGRGIESKCNSMGITIGCKIKVVTNKKHLPILINVRKADYAIGRGVASKIMVKKLESI